MLSFTLVYFFWSPTWIHTTGSMLRPGSCLASIIVTQTWKSCDFKWSLNLCILTLVFASWDGTSCRSCSVLFASFSVLSSFSFSLSLDKIDWALPVCDILSYCIVVLLFLPATFAPASSESAISDLFYVSKRKYKMF